MTFSIPAPDPLQQEVARAIADQVADLERVAKSANLGMLSYLLMMARMEAENAAGRN